MKLGIGSLWLILVVFFFNKAASQKNAEHVQSVKQLRLTDSFFISIQQHYDTAIVIGLENLGWGNARYELLCVNEGKWIAYNYNFDDMSPAIQLGLSTKTADSFYVNPSGCRQVLVSLLSDSILKKNIIDSGGCAQKSKQGYHIVEISDSPTLCLYFLTRKEVLKKEYYAPGFYEKYCPNKFRKRFLAFTDEVKLVTGRKEMWYSSNW